MNADVKVDQWQRLLPGAAFAPGDTGYMDAVGGFNLAAVRHPDVALSPRTRSEVVKIVLAARERQEPLVVVGGGHGDTPPVTGGTLLTTSRLRHVAVDTRRRTAVLHAGATWQDVLPAATREGLAPVCGSAPLVGAVGYLLGGGVGPLGRTLGFSSDYVRSFDVVTAHGDSLTASEFEHPDLFWALRGGKGGLGVVLSATVELPRLTRFYGGGEYYALECLEPLLHAFREVTTSTATSDALTTSLAIVRLPDRDFLPPPLRGQTVAHLRIGFVGAAAEAESLLRPLRQTTGTRIQGAADELPYTRIGTIHNDPTVASTHASGGLLLREMTDQTVRALLHAAQPQAFAPLSLVEVRHYGGALRRPINALHPNVTESCGQGADAVSGRDAAYGVWVSSHPDQTRGHLGLPEESPAAVRRVLDALQQWSTGAVQINFCGTVNTAQEAHAAWDREVARRLGDIRRRYDPEGLLPYTPGVAHEG